MSNAGTYHNTFDGSYGEPQSGGLISWKAYIITLIIVVFIVLISIYCLNIIGGVQTFEDACEHYGGSYYELQNVTCAAWHQNCRFMCSINGEQFSMDDLGNAGLLSYYEQFCVKGCAFKNKQAGGTVCVC